MRRYYNHRTSASKIMTSYWSADETKCLVASWKDAMVQHNINEIPITRNSFLYMEIADKMACHGFINKDWKQCRTKIKGLVTKYRKVNCNKSGDYY